MDAVRQGPAHPIALAALAALVFNDVVARVLWPSWVTGKASDVAWLVVAPLVVASVLAHLGARAPVARRCGLWGVGAAFVALQLWAPLGDTWVAWTGGTHLADAEDLICLPALALAPLVWRGRPRRFARAVLPIAAFACAATRYPWCEPTRFPSDGAPAWDPTAPLVLGNGVFGHTPHDTAGVMSAITLETARGEVIPLVGTTVGNATWLCPLGGLDPDTDYVWTIEALGSESPNHVQPNGAPPPGTTRFHTAPTGAFEPAETERDCERLVAEQGQSGNVCGDTGFDEPDDTAFDTGAP